MAQHDVMPDMELFQPVTVEDASAMAERLGGAGWVLAGGQDTYGWLKDRAKHPKAMIDLAAIESLRGIRETSRGLEIGAMTTLRDITRSEAVRSRFGLLADAADRVASPQIRNQGTLGGNLSQDTRCWYYRRGLSCYRAGGNICYADSPEGMNREHAIFGASRCVAVSPSDTATALVALDATMVIHNTDGESRVEARDFFVGPAVNITHMTVLRPGDILTKVEIPNTWAGATFYFEKVADRNVWDFALVSIAAAMKISGSVIEDARFVCGAVECVPRRLDSVERAVRGKPRNEQTGDSVAALASQGAAPLNYNHFKIPLVENLVRRALRT
jgi:xanthine dehydrogenase YagS FAD-binding subunit